MIDFWSKPLADWALRRPGGPDLGPAGLRPSAFRSFFFIFFPAFWPSAARYVVMGYKETEAVAACISGSTAWYVSVVIRIDASIACTVVSVMSMASGARIRCRGRTRSRVQGQEAQRMLEPLHADMCVVYGPDDEETLEIAEGLTRIRITLDGTRRAAPET
ncbi:hypothetical protein [Streptomyces sp. JNUCC 63]